MIDLATLKTEIQKPVYDGLSDFQTQQVLNDPGGPGSGDVEVSFISREDAQAAVVGVEFVSLSAAQQRLWQSIMNLSVVPVKNAIVRGQVMEVWAVNSRTRTNLVKLQTRTGSRAEVLFGDGTFVTRTYIRKARLLP